MLLSSPKSYANIVTALEILTEHYLILNFVKIKLLNEEHKRISNKIKTEDKVGYAISSNTHQDKKIYV